MEIGGRRIGPGHPVYVVAELSANHGQDLDAAIRLVQAAAAAGADAVKLQTYTPETITLDCDTEHFRIRGGTAWDGRTLHNLYSEAFTPWDWHPRLQREARSLGMELYSSPFDDTAVAYLETLDVPAYKIASPELVDLGLIRRASQTGRPLILSTGMATLLEIAEAVDIASSEGAGDLLLLKCTSAYPAPPAEANLRTIPSMAAAFGVPVGFSDHTLGTAAAVAAVALGAVMIEKHLTLNRDGDGPDVAFSLEPAEFAAMVEGIRVAEAALGDVAYGPTDREAGVRTLRRSLFAVADIPSGAPFTRENVRSIRPGMGLHTRHLPGLLDRVAARDVARGTPLAWADIGGIRGSHEGGERG